MASQERRENLKMAQLSKIKHKFEIIHKLIKNRIQNREKKQNMDNQRQESLSNSKPEISQRVLDYKHNSNQRNIQEDDDIDDIQIVRQLDNKQVENRGQFRRSNEENQENQAMLVHNGMKLRHTIRKDKNRDSQLYIYGKQIRDFFKKQKFNDLVLFTQADKKRFSEYDELRVGGEFIKLGQNVLIKNATNLNEDFIGKLTRIMSVKEVKTSKFIVLCEIKWYYKKCEIAKVKPQYKSWMSQNEVFQTDCSDVILATAISGQCSILSLEEYERLDNVERNVYFCRLAWIPTKGRFEGFQELRQHCLCKQPINPDLSYIQNFYYQCDRCDEWYHMGCVGVKKGEWEGKEYVCGRCR